MAKSIAIQELQRAKDEWMCNTLNELYDDMDLWRWNEMQHNRWARLKASNQVRGAALGALRSTAGAE